MNTRYPLRHRVAAEVRDEMVRQGRSVLDLAVALGVGVEEAQGRYDGTRELSLEELRAVALWLAVPIARFLTG